MLYVFGVFFFFETPYEIIYYFNILCIFSLNREKAYYL